MRSSTRTRKNTRSLFKDTGAIRIPFRPYYDHGLAQQRAPCHSTGRCATGRYHGYRIMEIITSTKQLDRPGKARTGRLLIKEGKGTMAVKIPIDLAQNGSARQALQQVKVQGDHWHLSVPPIIPSYRALRAQARRKATGRPYHKRGPGTFLGRLIAATRFWRELSRGGRPKRWPLTVILLPNQIGLER